MGQVTGTGMLTSKTLYMKDVCTYIRPYTRKRRIRKFPRVKSRYEDEHSLDSGSVDTTYNIKQPLGLPHTDVFFHVLRCNPS